MIGLKLTERLSEWVINYTLGGRKSSERGRCYSRATCNLLSIGACKGCLLYDVLYGVPRVWSYNATFSRRGRRRAIVEVDAESAPPELD
jgi:hypothetical protein